VPILPVGGAVDDAEVEVEVEGQLSAFWAS
jgi:hypothetical protein